MSNSFKSGYLKKKLVCFIILIIYLESVAMLKPIVIITSQIVSQKVATPLSLNIWFLPKAPREILQQKAYVTHSTLLDCPFSKRVKLKYNKSHFFFLKKYKHSWLVTS